MEGLRARRRGQLSGQRAAAGGGRGLQQQHHVGGGRLGGGRAPPQLQRHREAGNLRERGGAE